MKNFPSVAAGLVAAVMAFGMGGAALAQQSPPPPLVTLPPLDKTLRVAESAIVVVDFQNQFASSKGANYAAMEKQIRESNVIDNSLKLLEQARKLGIQVIHVTEGYNAEYREIDWGNGGTFHRGQILRQAWKSGTWETLLFDPIKDDRDLVFPDRKTLNGFGGNALDYALKSRGIRNVAVIGFTADVCVYATTLGGYDLGYRMYMLTDATIAADEAVTREMLRAAFPRVSRMMTSKDFLGMFSAADEKLLSRN